MSPVDRNHDEEDPILLELTKAVKSDTPQQGAYEAARLNTLRKLGETPEEKPFMTLFHSFTRPGVRWATGAGLAFALAVAIMFLNPFGRNPSQAYAAMADRLRRAVTVSFTAQYALGENQAPATLRIAYREPDLQRIEMEWQGVRNIQIIDTAHNKSLLLMPDTKTGIEAELTGAPSAERERIGLVQMLTKTVKTLPERADAMLGERTIDGRKATGFRVGESAFWIDAGSTALIRFEKTLGGRTLVMSDFRLDPPDLGAPEFSVKLPAGYTPMASAITLNAAAPGEENLIQYLRLASGMIKGRQFPATTNPMEIMKLQKEGKLEPAKENTPPATTQQFIQEFSQAAQGAVLFTMSLKPENDWHYAGQGAALGDAQTPIAWWKPSGLKNYRVIWGDLRVTEEPPEMIPTAKIK